MLAPQKILWSTPDEAVHVLARWIDLQTNDCVCDIGCGDGRVLLQWATALSSKQPSLSVTFIGIEIDLERSELARARVKEAYEHGIVSPNIRIHIHCANALDATHLYRNANVFFLYLIPRGLRRIQPLLKELLSTDNQHEEDCSLLRIVTYMSPLPNESHVAKELCRVPHQPGAAWPLYLYHMKPVVETITF